MQNTVTVRKRLFSRSSNWDVGEGAIANLDLISRPLTFFLQSEYLKDKTSIVGNTKLLFNLTDQDFEKMTECEYWEV